MTEPVDPDPDEPAPSPQAEADSHENGEVIDSPTVNSYVVGVTITEGEPPDVVEPQKG